VEEAADEAVVGDDDPGGPFLVDADVEQASDWSSGFGDDGRAEEFREEHLAPGESFQERCEARFGAGEAIGSGRSLELDNVGHLGDLVPGDPALLDRQQPAYESPEEAAAESALGALPSNHDRDGDAGAVSVESELDVVHASAVLAVSVDERVVEHCQCDVSLCH
jgi:hypothetical protein